MSRRSTRNTAGPSEIVGMPSVQTMPSIAPTPASSSVYLQNYYSHPANTRLLLGGTPQLNSKGHHIVGGAIPKPPKPPEKPLMPYMRYSRKVWDDVKASNPNLKLWEIGKIIGQQWRELPQLDKQQFIEEYEVEKIDHLEQVKLYHNSPAYQAYLHAKTRAEALEASAAAGDKDDAYMSIEPTDDGADDSDMCFSVKHVAAARFQRNHRLINDILGETIHVPSTRAVVTSQRLNVLKNQVQSLELHQKKLEHELQHLEEAHAQKKRKLVAQARDFGKEIKRLREITPQEYYKEYKLKQQQNAAAQQKLQEEERARKEKEEKEAKEKEAEKKEKEKSETEGEKKEITDDTKMDTTDTQKQSESDNKSSTDKTEEKTTENKEEKMEVEETAEKQEQEKPEENAVEKSDATADDVTTAAVDATKENQDTAVEKIDDNIKKTETTSENQSEDNKESTESKEESEEKKSS